MDYVATYPSYGITCRASDMILAGHSNAAYFNVSKACSRSGDHIFIYKDDPVHRLNESILNISQIIKFVMLSAVEAELAGLFILAKAMVPIRQNPIEMG